jgi:hypothetical protein
MQYQNTAITGLAYHEQAAILENYLCGLANEQQAFEILRLGATDLIGCVEDALTVIRLTSGDYPASVPVGLRRLAAHARQSLQEDDMFGARLRKFLIWVDATLSAVNDNAVTCEHIPVLIGEGAC